MTTVPALSRPDPEPSFAGVLEADATALGDYTARTEEMLAALPAKPSREPDQQRLADELHTSARKARAKFLRAHAAAVYDRITASTTDTPRLRELTERAALDFPGLTPTPEQLAEETRCLQADKEGREIDQGILLRELLRLPGPGTQIIEAMQRPTSRAWDLLPDFTRAGQLELGVVRIERHGDAAHVTMHNDDCLNAEDNRLAADLETAVDVVLLDERTSVGVLRGAPMAHPRYEGRRVFSAGINLKHLHQGKISYTDFLMGRELGLINKLLRGVLVDPGSLVTERTVEKPWVGVVDAFAIGGGMQLLLALDRVLAETDAYFSLPAAQEGIVPGAANFRLSRLLGARIAKQVILWGRVIRASDPDADLLCDEVVAPTELGTAIDRNIEHLASPAVVPNRRMLNLSDEPLPAFRSYIAEFALAQALRLYSQDVTVKVNAFSASRSARRETG